MALVSTCTRPSDASLSNALQCRYSWSTRRSRRGSDAWKPDTTGRTSGQTKHDAITNELPVRITMEY